MPEPTFRCPDRCAHLACRVEAPVSGLATTCTHPSAQRDVYRNNGRLFTYCRACDSDLSWAADNGSKQEGS